MSMVRPFPFPKWLILPTIRISRLLGHGTYNKIYSATGGFCVFRMVFCGAIFGGRGYNHPDSYFIILTRVGAIVDWQKLLKQAGVVHSIKPQLKLLQVYIPTVLKYHTIKSRDKAMVLHCPNYHLKLHLLHFYFSYFQPVTGVQIKKQHLYQSNHYNNTVVPCVPVVI